jgi:branched-chain amino acid transport system ATP-binding protein
MYSLVPISQNSTLGCEVKTDETIELKDAHVNYGSREVLQGCSLKLHPGELVALVGHNGAGKTTLLRAISGLVGVAKGSVTMGGRDLRRYSSARRARLGLGMVPDAGRGAVFSPLTVRENLRVAQDLSSRGIEVSYDEVRKLFPPLFEHLANSAGDLSGGERQMLAIAMSLLREPRFLLLDEPSVGLAPLRVTDAMNALRSIVDTFGIGILLVEQNVQAALRVADRIVVLKNGMILREFVPSEIGSVHELWELF